MLTIVHSVHRSSNEDSIQVHSRRVHSPRRRPLHRTRSECRRYHPRGWRGRDAWIVPRDYELDSLCRLPWICGRVPLVAAWTCWSWTCELNYCVQGMKTDETVQILIPILLSIIMLVICLTIGPLFPYAYYDIGVRPPPSGAPALTDDGINSSWSSSPSSAKLPSPSYAPSSSYPRRSPTNSPTDSSRPSSPSSASSNNKRECCTRTLARRNGSSIGRFRRK
jgi:hypothetical protein